MKIRNVLKMFTAALFSVSLLGMPVMAGETMAEESETQVQSETAAAVTGISAGAEAADPAEATDPEDAEISTEAETVDPKKPFVAYLSGVDTRAEKLEQSNGDVNVLMIVNPQTHNLLLLNTPRDYYVKNPAGNNAMDKLTHCAAYGIENSEKALSQLYGCDVDYYMQVNFVGFQKLIDALGGITVTSDVAYTIDYNGVGMDIVVGDNYMNGDQALAYVRDRYHAPYGDNGRGISQMNVVRGILKKVMDDPSVINNNLNEILEGMGETFETNIPVLTVFSMIADQVADAGSMDSLKAEWNVHEYAVTGHNGTDKVYSMSQPTNVMYQDEDLVKHASDLIRKVLGGEDLTDEEVGDIVQEW